MVCTELAPGADFALTARPNNSLSAESRRRVLGGIVGVILAVSIGFASFGAWPVLPFAGLEIAVLVWAFRWMDRHAGDFERIVISGDRVVLEAADGGRAWCHEFNRYWASLAVRRDPAGGGVRLALRSHGREVQFGRFLNEDERAVVAQELRSRLGFK